MGKEIWNFSVEALWCMLFHLTGTSNSCRRNLEESCFVEASWAVCIRFAPSWSSCPQLSSLSCKDGSLSSPSIISSWSNGIILGAFSYRNHILRLPTVCCFSSVHCVTDCQVTTILFKTLLMCWCLSAKFHHSRSTMSDQQFLWLDSGHVLSPTLVQHQVLVQHKSFFDTVRAQTVNSVAMAVLFYIHELLISFNQPFTSCRKESVCSSMSCILTLLLFWLHAAKKPMCYSAKQVLQFVAVTTAPSRWSPKSVWSFGLYSMLYRPFKCLAIAVVESLLVPNVSENSSIVWVPGKTVHRALWFPSRQKYCQLVMNSFLPYYELKFV